MTSPSGLWAEGDPLSPTNLNRRSPAGNFPAKTYHVAWAAGTGTTQITNAIANAAAGGYTAVFIDASRLPYTASQVTFNPNIHMMREGGSLDQSVVDVEAYGASVGGADCYAAFTAAIARSYAGNVTRKVFLPTLGSYYHTQPIWAKNLGFHIESVNERTTLQPTGYTYGPILIVQPENALLSIPTSTALLTGTGSSLNLTGSNGFWLNLRDASTLDIDGLSAFTVEMTVKLTATVAFTLNLCSSSGKMLHGDTITHAFQMQLQDVGGSNAQLYTEMKVGGVTHTMTPAGGSIVNGGQYHFALTYDGTTIRSFIDGVLLASTGATGTINQDAAEEVTVGPSILRSPDALEFGAPHAQLDSIRVSNIARYTANFTKPTAKFSSDANTLILLNFDNQVSMMTKASTKNGDAWLYSRQPAVVGLSPINYPTITRLAFGLGDYIGLVLYETFKLTVREVSFLGNRWCVLPQGNQFFGSWYDVEISGSDSPANRYGIITNSLTLWWLYNIRTVGYAFPFIAEGGLAAVTGLFIELRRISTVIGLVLRGEATFSPTIAQLTMNTENAVSQAGTIRASIALSNPNTAIAPAGATFVGGQIGTAIGKDPVILDKFNGATFTGMTFASSGNSHVVTVLNKADQPLYFDGLIQTGTTVPPLSDTTGAVVIGRIGALNSASTGSTINFDASKSDVWDLTLSSDVTISTWSNINYGQPVSGAIKMDSTGSRLFTWPTNSKGTVTLSYGSAAVNTFSGFYDGVNVILTSVRTGL